MIWFIPFVLSAIYFIVVMSYAEAWGKDGHFIKEIIKNQSLLVFVISMFTIILLKIGEFL